jgi:amino acid adenylation domain-containing protein
MVLQNELARSLKANSTRTAIECGNRSVSYAQLREMSDQVTEFLRRRGLEKETIVGVFLQDRPLLIAAMIGIMNARCTFVPIDGTFPPGRLEAIGRALGLQHLITSRELPDLAPALGNAALNRYCVEDLLAEEAPAGRPANPPPAYEPDDSLYIYFTSGSTGTPKGVIGRNCSLLQFARWEIDAFHVGPDSRVSQLISPYFDAFLRDVFVPLLAGGTLCVPPARSVLSSEQLIPWVDASRITLIHCVPSVFRVINRDTLTPEQFGALRHVLLSGERIVPAELENWYHVFGPRIQLVNLYGATETTMIRACYPIQPEDVHLNRIPIGYPIRDTTLLVTRKDFVPCQPLVTGDLYIVSKYVTKGYLNDPALTQDRFIRLHPGSPQETIAFKTGDKARMLPDGKIDLIGREDRQVKVRGIRVEPGEIESVLFRSQRVENAFVFKHTEANGNEVLMAFVILKEAFRADPNCREALLAHLKNDLPDYLIPANLAVVAEFPLLPSGKIDSQELLSRLATRAVTAPANETERRLLALWQEILGNAPISTQDNFYGVGGNSLAIMRLLGKIYKEFSVRVPLSAFFANPTICKLAQFIEQSRRDKLFVITPVEARPAYCLTAAQERLYYHYELDKTSTAFNVPMAWQVGHDLEVGRIEAISRRLIERHESLRTEFGFTGGKLGQVVKPAVDFAVEEMDCRDRPADEALRAFIRPFDLGKAPLVRCGLITTREHGTLLVLDVHHIVYDGMSQINLLSDFVSLYQGESLPPLTIQPKDFAEWEHGFRTTDVYLGQREFWLKSFEGEIPRLRLPSLHTEAGGSMPGGVVAFEMDRAVIHSILGQAEGDGLNAFAAWFSLFFVYLSQLTGQEDLVVGTNTTGRMQLELEKLVGMFTKTLPIRRRVDPNARFIDFAREVHAYLIEANSRQLYDLADMLNELNNGRATPVKNLIDVMFVFQNFDDRSLQSNEAGFVAYPIENTVAKFPLSFFARETDATINFWVEYASAYFTKADVQLLIAQFKSVVLGVTANPAAPIREAIGSPAAAPQPVEEAITFHF